MVLTQYRSIYVVICLPRWSTRWFKQSNQGNRGNNVLYIAFTPHEEAFALHKKEVLDCDCCSWTPSRLTRERIHLAFDMFIIEFLCIIFQRSCMKQSPLPVVLVYYAMQIGPLTMSTYLQCKIKAVLVPQFASSKYPSTTTGTSLAIKPNWRLHSKNTRPLYA